MQLFNEFFTEEKFIRILVHFDLSEEVLLQRVKTSNRSTNIFRESYSSFQQVLNQQQKAPSENISSNEADYLFVIKDNAENDLVIEQIIEIAQSISP